MNKLTKQQGIIITGYTGKLACNFSDFVKDVEKKLGRPVLTHELIYIDTVGLYREDFIKLCAGKKK